VAVAVQHLQGSIPSVNDGTRRTSDAVAAAITTATAVAPEDRFAAADDFRAALQGEPVTARTVALDGGAAAAHTVLLADSAATRVLSPSAATVVTASGDLVSPRRRSRGPVVLMLFALLALLAGLMLLQQHPAKSPSNATASKPGHSATTPAPASTPATTPPASPTQVVVPNFVGMTAADASSAAIAAGLSPRYAVAAPGDNPQDIAVGSVIRQDPAPDAMIDPGSSITLTLASTSAQFGKHFPHGHGNKRD